MGEIIKIDNNEIENVSSGNPETRVFVDKMEDMVQIFMNDDIYFARTGHPVEMNSPIIERDGVYYLNLSVQNNGVPTSIVRHTSEKVL